MPPHVCNRSRLTLLALLVLIMLATGGCAFLESVPDTVPESSLEPDSIITEEPGSQGREGQFDFYVLVLSWSPTYCSTNGDQDPQQCSVGRKLGFVLHGLWPQYDRGYPSNCSTARLPASLKSKYAELYPSPKLFDHEWEKHGTCSGLSPDNYLALSKRLKESVAIPSRYRSPDQPLRVSSTQLKQDLIAANSTLGESSLATFCSGSGRYLQELYVCFSPDGKAAACSSEIQSKAARSCQSANFIMRNVR